MTGRLQPVTALSVREIGDQRVYNLTVAKTLPRPREWAHRYGKEARKGPGYEHSGLREVFDHRRQHMVEKRPFRRNKR